MMLLRLVLISLALAMASAASAVSGAIADVHRPVQPLFEQQEAVWPDFAVDDDEETDVSEAPHQQHVVPGAAAIEEQELANVLPTFDGSSTHLDELDVHAGYPVPIYEDQVVVYPNMEDEQDTWATQQVGHNDKHGQITVVENYHIIHPDGTSEYKLLLSNGMRDYKKITKKLDGKRVIYEQQGYYSVPVAGKHRKFSIIFYISDEHGFRIQKVEQCSERHPC